MADLIALLEASTEGSRELDGLIAVAIFETQSSPDDLIYASVVRSYDHEAPGTYWRVSRSGKQLQTAPNYTTSLDAFEDLRPAGANCWGFEAEPNGVEAYWSRNQVDAGHWLVTGHHKTSAPIAFCIAAIKARIALAALMPTGDK